MESIHSISRHILIQMTLKLVIVGLDILLWSRIPRLEYRAGPNFVFMICWIISLQLIYLIYVAIDDYVAKHEPE